VPSPAVRAALPATVEVFRRQAEARLRSVFAPHQGGVYDLASYHLGFTDERGRPANGAGGKLLRPVLCLVTASGYGDYQRALDVAVALELLHAFSLVHDDIEDGDDRRRHRPTLWALHGVPLALNAGDSLFALAHRVLGDACQALTRDEAGAAMRTFSDAALRMIEGQHWDIEFESRPSVTLAQYEAMSAGKTGALLGAALALGAICGGASSTDVDRLRDAGVQLGLAFQAIDDALAVWGDASVTGKPAGNDVARGKKSLAVVLAAAAGASAVEDPSLRGEIRRIATEHAERVREHISATTISAAAAADLEALAAFVLDREL
jgi:geranylgeranyl diphosphate synthase, type I